MFFEDCFSQAGRVSAGNLECLRIQLGRGVDPAIDYSKDRSIAHEARPSRDAVDPYAADPELLHNRIQDLIGGEPGCSNGKRPNSAILLRGEKARQMMLEKHEREASRPSSAFRSRSREQRNLLDKTNAFRAPPVGTYKPNTDACFPRLPSTVPFAAPRPPPGAEQEEASKGDVKSTADKEDGPPEFLSAAPPKDPQGYVVDFAKVPPRPDFFKSLPGCNENSFTEGLVDGHLHTSQSTRPPAWDFGKLVPHPARNAESYAEPGLYNVKDTVVRPRSGGATMPFGRQVGRRPVSAPVHSGHNRASTTKSCPVLSSERRVRGIPNLSKCTARPSILPSDRARAEPEDEDDEQDETEQLDTSAARPKSAFVFKQGISREQHIRALRNYGDDICLQRMKDNLTKGPVSVEYKSDVDDRPCLRRAVTSFDFNLVPGREPAKKCQEPPARSRIPGRAAKFGRGTRKGDARRQVRAMSSLAGAITQLRQTRGHEDLGQGGEAG